MRRTARRGERGSTLIEAAIASGVFMVGVLGLVPLFYTSSQGVAVASRLTQATALATSRLDQLERLPFVSTHLAEGERQDGEKNLNADGTAASGDWGAHDGTFYRKINVEPWDENDAIPGNDYKRITVTVAWYDGSAGQERSVTVMGGKAREP